MHSFDDRLWNALEATRIVPEGAALTFEARLAREQGWSAAYTAKVMREYRRFLYLAATAPGQVTPSDAVDAAWHLHLSYTRHYWEELCPNILGRPLHHQPTEGGPAERARFHDQYARTLAVYEATFGERPPASVWPSVNERSAEARRLPTGSLAVAGFASMLLAACTALAGNAGGESGGSGAIVIPIVIGVFVFVVLASLIFGAKMKKQKDDGSCSSFFSSDGGGDGDSGCGGGCGGGD